MLHFSYCIECSRQQKSLSPRSHIKNWLNRPKKQTLNLVIWRLWNAHLTAAASAIWGENHRLCAKLFTWKKKVQIVFHCERIFLGNSIQIITKATLIATLGGKWVHTISGLPVSVHMLYTYASFVRWCEEKTPFRHFVLTKNAKMIICGFCPAAVALALLLRMHVHGMHGLFNERGNSAHGMPKITCSSSWKE